MKKFLFLIVAFLLALTACSTGTNKTPDTKLQKPIGLIDQPAPIEKVLVIVEENHSAAQMKAQMPYLKSLGDKYASFADWDGVYHPSQPNYFVYILGENKGVTSNTLRKVPGPSVMGDAIKAGYSAKVTADGMGKANRCKTSGTSPYAARHNVWCFIIGEETLSKRYDYDYAYWSGDVAAQKLGNIHFLIPSNNHNGHDKSLKAADDWLKGALKYVLAGPDWASGKLLVLITADEDDKKSGQNVYTVAMHPSLDKKVVSGHFDHYALNKMLYSLIHQTPRGAKAKTAPDVWSSLGLTYK